MRGFAEAVERGTRLRVGGGADRPEPKHPQLSETPTSAAKSCCPVSPNVSSHGSTQATVRGLTSPSSPVAPWLSAHPTASVTVIAPMPQRAR